MLAAKLYHENAMQDHNPNFSQLLPYYQREMSYLLKIGQKFAKAYPRIAGDLELSPKGSDDPHIERLLESFAFLTGRLQMAIDDQHSDISNALLSLLYPEFIKPFPSCVILKMQAFKEMVSLFQGRQMPARTPLAATSQEGISCRFQTTMPVDIWPIDVVDVGYVTSNLYAMPAKELRSPWLLKVTLKTHGGLFSDLSLDDLTFYLGGDTLTAFTLLKWLHTYDTVDPTPVFIQKNSKEPVLELLRDDAFQRAGFEPNEGLLEATPKTNPAHRLLWDFFHFPQKFLFFKVQHLKEKLAQVKSETVTLFFPLSGYAEPEKWPLSTQNVMLGCVPAINLFQKSSEPIKLDYRKTSYRLVPDHRLEEMMEVHTILKISSATSIEMPGHVVEPYFSYTHQAEEKQQEMFWFDRRMQTSLEDARGTDVFLSFVNYDMKMSAFKEETVYAHMLCTNRRLAEKLPVGVHFDVQGRFSGMDMVSLTKPTRALNPSLDGQTQWRLISHLAVDHLGLCAHLETLAPLKELLRLYNTGHASLGGSIEALESLSFRRTIGPLAQEGWHSFVPLLSVTLKVDDAKVNVHGYFVLSMILHELFKLTADFNTLVETNLMGLSDTVLKKWEAEPCVAKTI